MDFGVKNVLERETILTPAGYNKLKAELNTLKTVKRKEITAKIREALDFGDAWGNPEYEWAKQEQAFIEGRIKTLETLLSNAKVINVADKSGEVVSLGSVVTVLDLETEDVVCYTIVGSGEADPLNNRISYKSPVAQSLLGHKKGDTVEADCPVGIIELKILDIQAGTGQIGEDVG